jgi:hypothetical protein
LPGGVALQALDNVLGFFCVIPLLTITKLLHPWFLKRGLLTCYDKLMPLLIVTNKEPLRQKRGRWVPGADGLTTALLSVLEEQGGTWVTWGEKRADEVPELRYPEDNPRFSVQRLYLNKQELKSYYFATSNMKCNTPRVSL